MHCYEKNMQYEIKYEEHIYIFEFDVETSLCHLIFKIFFIKSLQYQNDLNESFIVLVLLLRSC